MGRKEGGGRERGWRERGREEGGGRERGWRERGREEGRKEEEGEKERKEEQRKAKCDLFMNVHAVSPSKHTFSIVISVCFFLARTSLPPPPGPSEPLVGISIVLRGAEMVDTLNFPRVPLNSTGLYERSSREI